MTDVFSCVKLTQPSDESTTHLLNLQSPDLFEVETRAVISTAAEDVTETKEKVRVLSADGKVFVVVDRAIHLFRIADGYEDLALLLADGECLALVHTPPFQRPLPRSAGCPRTSCSACWPTTAPFCFWTPKMVWSATHL